MSTELINALDLLDNAAIQADHILGFDVGGLVGTQQLQLGADAQQLVQDGLFLGIQRSAHRGRVGHDGSGEGEGCGVGCETESKHGGQRRVELCEKDRLT